MPGAPPQIFCRAIESHFPAWEGGGRGSSSFPRVGLAREGGREGLCCSEGPSPLVGEVEAKRHLEVQLNGGTLVVSPQSVLDLNVHLQRRTKHQQGKTEPPE